MSCVLLSIALVCMVTMKEFNPNHPSHRQAEKKVVTTELLNTSEVFRPNVTREDVIVFQQSDLYYVRKMAAVANILDHVFVVYFLLEYIVSLFVCPDVWKFVKSKSAIVDIVVLTPDIASLLVEHLINSFQSDLRMWPEILQVFELVRIARLFRVFRLLNQMPSLWIAVNTLKHSLEELFIILGILAVATLLFASAESLVEPEEGLSSVPIGAWWAMVTMTTVGFGREIPVSIKGKLIGATCALAGVITLSVSVPILTNNFTTTLYGSRYVQFKEAEFLRVFKGQTTPEDSGKLLDEETVVSDQVKRSRQLCIQSQKKKDEEFVNEYLAWLTTLMDTPNPHSQAVSLRESEELIRPATFRSMPHRHSLAISNSCKNDGSSSFIF